MFKKTLTRLSFAIPALLAATQASAHSGGHVEMTTSQVINHMLSSPFHTGLIASVAIASAYIIWKVSFANQSE